MPKKPRADAASPGPSERSPLTLADVAKIAGVSPITVSRTLSRPEMVTKRTRERVLEAVRVTGYVPPTAGLGAGRSRLVAIFLPTISNSIFADLVQTLMNRLAEAGYQTLLGLTGYCPEKEETLLDAILRRRPDGVILTGTLHTPASRERLALAGIPVVEAWDLDDSPIDMLVGFSHRRVGRAMGAYFLDKGYRRFSVVTVDDARGLQRCGGLLDELARQGIAEIPVEILPLPATLEVGREGLRRLLARASPPDIVVCSSDTVAQGVLTEAFKQGLRVPRDLAVMGFGNFAGSVHLEPPLSSVEVRSAVMGERIAEVLLERIRHGRRGEPPARVDVGFELLDRGTT